MSPAWAAPRPLVKTFTVEISGVDPLQGLGVQGLRSNASFLCSSLCKIPPALPRVSDCVDRRHAGGCTEMSPKTPKEIRKTAISTSIKVMPVLLVIELHIGPSRNGRGDRGRGAAAIGQNDFSGCRNTPPLKRNSRNSPAKNSIENPNIPPKGGEGYYLNRRVGSPCFRSFFNGIG